MEYLKIWVTFREAMEALTDAEKGRLFVAMLDYAASGTEPQLSGNERYVWPSARQNIKHTVDENERMRLMGMKGGRQRKPDETYENLQKPTETYENLQKPDETYCNPIKEKEKDKDNYIKENPLKGVKEKRDRFSPPSLEEVTAYCHERGNSVDPQSFLDFYASKGWKVGNQPMKDWKASVRTWESRDKAPQKQKPKLLRAQDYEQREYKESELKQTLGVGDIFAMSADEFNEHYAKGAAG